MTVTGLPARLDHERYCRELVHQDALLRARLARTEPTAAVPTCPGWTAADLARHVEENLHALTAAVGAVGPGPGADGGAGGGTGFVPGSGSAAPAETCAAALRAAGPEAEVELFGITQPALAWARRAAYDVLIHRADVEYPAQPDPAPAPEVAADAVDELLTITSAAVPDDAPAVRLIATDTADDWQTAAATVPTVTLRGPLTDLLLLAYRRLPVADARRVEVRGDTAALHTWLDHIALT